MPLISPPHPHARTSPAKFTFVNGVPSGKKLYNVNKLIYFFNRVAVSLSPQVTKMTLIIILTAQNASKKNLSTNSQDSHRLNIISIHQMKNNLMKILLVSLKYGIRFVETNFERNIIFSWKLRNMFSTNFMYKEIFPYLHFITQRANH